MFGNLYNMMINKLKIFDNKDTGDLKYIIIDIFKEVDNNIHTGQVHCDILFHSIDVDYKGVIEVKDKIYRDVKADYKGTAKGHFTIIPFLFSDWIVAKRYVSNYCDYFNDVIPKHSYYFTLSKEEKDKINILKENLLILKNTLKKSISIEQIKPIIIKCNNILLGTYMNDAYIKLNIHFTIATDLNVNEEYINDILSIITTNYNLFDINTLFPKNNKINHRVYKEKTIEIMNTIFPEPLRSQLLSNYNKYIKDHDK